jgi:hypothetical protein
VPTVRKTTPCPQIRVERPTTPRRSVTLRDVQRLEQVWIKQDGLFTRSQAGQAGVSRSALAWRSSCGTWRQVLPGIFASFTGALTERQQWRAALLYVGPAGMLCGPSACRLLSLRAVPPTTAVHVLVPNGAPRPRPVDFVLVHRTRVVTRRYVVSGLSCTSLPRAVIDTARVATDKAQARALIAEALQRGRTTVEALRAEVPRGQGKRRTTVDAILDEVAAGARSAPEAELLRLVLQARLPQPACNEPIRLPDGMVVVPDFRWGRLVAEVDSKQWHLSPAEWAATMARHNQLIAAGYTVLHFTPHDIRQAPESVVKTIWAALLTPR